MYDFTAITKVCVEFKRQNLPCYPSTLNKKTKKNMHRLLPGSNLFDFKLYLLIT